MKFSACICFISAACSGGLAQPVLPTLPTSIDATTASTTLMDAPSPHQLPTTANNVVGSEQENQAHGLRITLVNQSPAVMYSKRFQEQDDHYVAIPPNGVPSVVYDQPGGRGMVYSIPIFITNAATPNFPQGAGNDTYYAFSWANEWIGYPYVNVRFDNEKDPAFPPHSYDENHRLSEAECADFVVGGRRQMRYCRNDDSGPDGIKDLTLYLY